MTTLIVNGKQMTVNAEPDTPLLWVLRGELKLVGTKYGCGRGLCGACTVHIDGEPVRSCLTPLARRPGPGDHHHRRSWRVPKPRRFGRPGLEIDVVQCGCCQSGQLMSACALLKAIPEPSRQDIDRAMTETSALAEPILAYAPR